MLHRLALAVLIATSVCGHARPGAAGEPSRPLQWTGFYVGGHIGSLWNSGGVTQEPFNANANFYFIGNVISRTPIGEDRGIMGGAQIGYNSQTGWLVYGAEADLSAAQIDGSNARSEPFALGVIVDTTAERKLSAFATLRGRLGVMPFERVLLYATGGLALGRATLANSFTLMQGGAPICGAATGECASASTSTWLTGWTLGGGVEQAGALAVGIQRRESR
jgi:outer membrane immunogenic protein